MARKLKTVEGTANDTPIVTSDNAVIQEPPITIEPDSLVDPLIFEQKEQANLMRKSLLTCRTGTISNAKVALQNIAVLQIYHEVARIIRFIEVMDRLEDKIYDSIDMNIGGMESADPATMLMLVKVQGDLYKTMAMSQELLKPYMNIDLEAIAPMKDVNEDIPFGVAIIPKESRNVIRNGAQALLTELRNAEKPSQENEATETDDGNNRADTQ
jgi:hypothetical protein